MGVTQAPEEGKMGSAGGSGGGVGDLDSAGR